LTTLQLSLEILLLVNQLVIRNSAPQAPIRSYQTSTGKRLNHKQWPMLVVSISRLFKARLRLLPPLKTTQISNRLLEIFSILAVVKLSHKYLNNSLKRKAICLTFKPLLSNNLLEVSMISWRVLTTMPRLRWLLQRLEENSLRSTMMKIWTVI